MSHVSTLLSPPQGGDQGHTHVVIKTKFYYPWGDSMLAQWWRIHLQCRSHRWQGFDSWVGKIPWRRTWQSIQAFLPRESLDRGAWWATVYGVQRVGDKWSDLACSTCQKNAAQMIHRSDSYFFWIYEEMWFYFSQRFIIVPYESTFCWWPVSGFWL